MSIYFHNFLLPLIKLHATPHGVSGSSVRVQKCHGNLSIATKVSEELFTRAWCYMKHSNIQKKYLQKHVQMYAKHLTQT